MIRDAAHAAARRMPGANTSRPAKAATAFMRWPGQLHEHTTQHGKVNAYYVSTSYMGSAFLQLPLEIYFPRARAAAAARFRRARDTPRRTPSRHDEAMMIDIFADYQPRDFGHHHRARASILRSVASHLRLTTAIARFAHGTPPPHNSTVLVARPGYRRAAATHFHRRRRPGAICSSLTAPSARRHFFVFYASPQRAAFSRVTSARPRPAAGHRYFYRHHLATGFFARITTGPEYAVSQELDSLATALRID